MVIYAESLSDFGHCTLTGTLANWSSQFERDQNHEGSGIEDMEGTVE